jgi:hypothetical protein
MVGQHARPGRAAAGRPYTRGDAPGNARSGGWVLRWARAALPRRSSAAPRPFGAWRGWRFGLPADEARPGPTVNEWPTRNGEGPRSPGDRGPPVGRVVPQRPVRWMYLLAPSHRIRLASGSVSYLRGSATDRARPGRPPRAGRGFAATSWTPDRRRAGGIAGTCADTRPAGGIAGICADTPPAVAGRCGIRLDPVEFHSAPGTARPRMRRRGTARLRMRRPATRRPTSGDAPGPPDRGPPGARSVCAPGHPCRFEGTPAGPRGRPGSRRRTHRDEHPHPP